MTNGAFADFHIPGVGKICQTWYRVVGDIKAGVPLIIVHGGPGAAHEYLLSLEDLSKSHDVPLIFYDQIGCGRSTALKEKAGDEAFWTEDLFHRELDNLIDHVDICTPGFDLLGHSWGGMMSASYAAKRPEGLRKLIIANAPSSIETWLQGVNTLRSQLPEKVQKVLDRCEREGKMESKEYEDAVNVFYQRHLCLKRPWPPKEVELALDHVVGDPTVYGTMYGVSELVVTGNLKDWSVVSQASNIQASVLLINGVHDEAQDVCIQPFFANISKVKWVTLENAGHFAHVDVPRKFIEVVAGFLKA